MVALLFQLVAPPAPAGAGRGWRSARRCRWSAGSSSRSALGAVLPASARRSARPTGRWPASSPCCSGRCCRRSAVLLRRGGRRAARGGAGRARRARRTTRRSSSREPRQRRTRPGAWPPSRQASSVAEPAMTDARVGTPTSRDAADRESGGRSKASSACRRPRATASRSCATATRSSPPCSRRSTAAEHTIDFLTFVYWEGEIGDDVRRDARRPRPRRASGSASCSTRGAPSPMDKTLIDRHGAGRCARALVPAAAPAASRAAQPPHAPQGADRRRGRRASPAASASPTSGGATPATSTSGATPTSASTGPAVDGLRAAFLDNWAETDPVLFDERRRPLPRPAPARRDASCSACGARRRPGWSDVATLFRTLLQAGRGAHPHHHGVLRARRRAGRPPVRRGRPRGARSQILLPGPHADKRFVQIAGEAPVRPAARARRARSGTSSRRCSTPRS